ncbi:uncharacterized protein LOC111033415 isoform X2 [Myzus persicae]|uniref:uncharacterized protein LOC111033415 isoform X2 n=1 Tax=Myzus persicae TaxID=13164 RepID=UPI000B931926|nr:uncharacterized protein LOC111033415 isoform X2 [Myzus persicae]
MRTAVIDTLLPFPETSCWPTSSSTLFDYAVYRPYDTVSFESTVHLHNVSFNLKRKRHAIQSGPSSRKFLGTFLFLMNNITTSLRHRSWEYNKLKRVFYKSHTHLG